MSLIQRLVHQHSESHAGASCSEEEIQSEVDRLRREEAATASGSGIPRFYVPKPQPGSILALLAAATHERVWEERSSLKPEQMARLEDLLLTHCMGGRENCDPATPAPQGQKQSAARSLAGRRITYEGFSLVATQFAELYGQATRTFFAPSTFLKFERDAEGALPVTVFLQYVRLKSYRLHLWRRLSDFDGDQDGSLNEREVTEAIVSLAGEVDYTMARGVLEHWKIIAPRKTMFFLAKNSLVAISDLLASTMLDEITEWRATGGVPVDMGDRWFAVEKSMAIHDKFCELDVDCDGKLSPSELSRLRLSHLDCDTPQRPSSMTAFFLTRVFEVHVRGISPVSGAPAMDLAEFSDFLLAWSLRGELPSLRYFFRVLDVEHTGRLTAPVVAEFTKRVFEKWSGELHLWEYEHRDVKDEIFDMVTPRNPAYITLQDLQQCGVGEHICGMLVDTQCYFEYDQREQLAQQEED